MTHQQFEDKVADLAKDAQDFINERAKKIISSGCIDFDQYENNYILPKLFMCAIGREIDLIYFPYSTTNKIRKKKEIKNIMLFL